MSSKYKIMIVDDDPVLREDICKMLSNEGFEVEMAASSDECLDTIAFINPDLVIIEAAMKGIDGFELCTSIKEDPPFKEVPVVFISNLENRDDLLKGYSAGGVDFISKNVDNAIILARVKAILKMRSLMQDRETLMKANESLLAKVQKLFQEESLSSKIDMLKEGVAGGSDRIAEKLDRIRFISDNKEINDFVNQVELALEFGDRTSQQLNEIAKAIHRLHNLISGADKEDKNLVTSSSASVFMEKKDQGEIDDLLSSLGL